MKSETLIQHRQEYLNTVTVIENKIKLLKSSKRNPWIISNWIFEKLKDASLNDLTMKEFQEKGYFHKSYSLGDYLRKFHDFYNWQSGEGVVCSGTPFRSKHFMMVDMTERSGLKIDKNTDRGVHIEHAIPIKILSDLLWADRKNITGPQDVFDRLIGWTVTVALTRHEEETMIMEGFNSSHPDINNDTAPDMNMVNPMKRYTNELRDDIYDVRTGRKVSNSNFTLMDHKMMMVENIYQWKFLDQWYGNK